MPLKSGLNPEPNWLNPCGKFTVLLPKFRFVGATEVILALSSAKASQKALWVMKLSFLFDYINSNTPSKKLMT
uniref:Zinc finger protein JACKDAW-like n=1 Tax=Rhizophora mucronata TaxID=61149 RepID=A0A2P2M5H5_RHIMU